MDLFLQAEKILARAQMPGADTGSNAIYPRSRFTVGDMGICLVREGPRKSVCVAASSPEGLCGDMQGEIVRTGDVALKLCPTSHANAEVLRALLPWTAPVSLRERRTTFGCGDRLGRATPGHLRAVARYDAAPVLAQQSIRELNLTGRTYENVVDDVTFLVLQEGYSSGYGADGDHLKTLADINMAIDAGMAMITLDLSEVMLADAENWSETEVAQAFAELPEATRTRVEATYAGETFHVGDASVRIEPLEAKRCAVMYMAAMDFAAEVYQLLRERRGHAFDLEVSIDETEAPTLPAHHLFIIKELLHRDIEVSSLAPRFIGEFQKAIDYIGDLAEFERQFAIHCAIAKTFGDYKVSIHSGSDKFAAYPIIGKHTAHRVHVKTAGTSWLEALRAVADSDPVLFRDLHQKAVASYPDALRYYHVTPDLSRAPDPDALPDAELSGVLDQDDARQLLHVTYGGILADEALATRFFAALDAHEEVYYAHLERHFRRHLDALGLAEQDG